MAVDSHLKQPGTGEQSSIGPPTWSHGLDASDPSSMSADRMIYVSLEGSVYRLHVFMLQLSSSVLHGLFKLPASLGQEGNTRDQPFALDQHAPASYWHVYLSFVYRPSHFIDGHNRPQQYWLDLLAFAHKFDAPHALSKAKAVLAGSNSSTTIHLSAAHRFYLGRLYGFNDWVEYSAPIIVRTPPSDLSAEDFTYLGVETIRTLVDLHNRLTRHRQRIVSGLPSLIGVHATECLEQARCSASWRRACDQLMLAMFSDLPLTERQVVQRLHNQEHEATPIAAMSVGCRDRVVRIVEKSFVGRDDDLIAQTIQSVCGIKTEV